MSNPSQGGQYCRITPLEEGVAPAHRPTICDAPLYAVPLPPYSLDVRFGGSGTAYSKAAYIPVRRAGATPLSLKVHPLCLQNAELHCTLGMSLYNFPGNERRQVLFMKQALESD